MLNFVEDVNDFGRSWTLRVMLTSALKAPSPKCPPDRSVPLEVTELYLLASSYIQIHTPNTFFIHVSTPGFWMHACIHIPPISVCTCVHTHLFWMDTNICTPDFWVHTDIHIPYDVHTHVYTPDSERIREHIHQIQSAYTNITVSEYIHEYIHLILIIYTPDLECTHKYIHLILSAYMNIHTPDSECIREHIHQIQSAYMCIYTRL